MRAGLPLLSLFLLCGCASEPAPEGPEPAWEVVINEFQADNVSTLADESGEFDDWIELFNPTDEPADLTGHYLTDDLQAPTAWRFPAGTMIDALGYLVVWADGAPDGTLHTSFSLSAGGEQIGLFAPLAWDGVQIDAGEYEQQAADQSMARWPDGALTWQADPSPTPGRAND